MLDCVRVINFLLLLLIIINNTLPRVTSLLKTRFDPRLSSVIINNVHTATVCCRGNATDDDVDDDELVQVRRALVQVTSLITFNTSFRPTLRTAVAAAWRLEGLSQPNTHTQVFIRLREKLQLTTC